MRKKVLFTSNYGNDFFKSIEELGYDIVVRREENIVNDNEVNQCEILVCYDPFKTLNLDEMKNLKWIQVQSVGVDQVPKDKIIKDNIALTNNKGIYSIPIGEWIVLKALEMLKHSKAFYEKQRDKKWKMDLELGELYGKTVGFIGTGDIGIEAAKMLEVFGCKVIGCNTKGDLRPHFSACYEVSKIDEMLKHSDIVVITVPCTDKTYKMINEDRFKAMKDGVLLINISRGTVIDEKILIKELKSKKVAMAALDVTEIEPLDSKSELWDLSNVIITPHNSWISDARHERKSKAIYENLKRYSENRQFINVVNASKGY